MGKSLLERFEEQSYDLYRKYSNKPNNATEHPIIEMRPDEDNPDGRNQMLLRDGPIQELHTERMSKFENITAGKLFVDKNKDLQKLNTFQQTRELSSTIISDHTNATTSKTRHTRTERSQGNPDLNYTGLLQDETRNRVRESVKYKIATERGSLLLRDDDTRGLFDRAGDSLRDAARGATSYIVNLLTDPFTRFYEYLSLGFRQSSRNRNRLIRDQKSLERASRPELSFRGDPSARSSTYFDYLLDKYKWDNDFRQNLLRMVTVNRLESSLGKPDDRKSGNLTAYVSYDYRDSYKNFVEFIKNNYTNERDPRPTALRKHKDFRRKIRYFKDLTQVMDEGIIAKEEIPYGYDKDVVDLVFTSLSSQPTIWRTVEDRPVSVRFRALIENLSENVTPEYTEKKYLGRIEKFYVYSSVTRQVSMKIILQAFSEKELQHIWSKVNYLTSLAYPQDYRAGYPTPTFFKFRIGNIFDEQPAIIKNIRHSFVEGGDSSWDTEEQLPQRVVVDLELELLDKTLFTHGRASYRSRVGTVTDRSLDSYLYHQTDIKKSVTGVGSEVVGDIPPLFNRIFR